MPIAAVWPEAWADAHPDHHPGCRELLPLSSSLSNLQITDEEPGPIIRAGS